MTRRRTPIPLPTSEEIAAKTAEIDRKAEALGLNVGLAVTLGRGQTALRALLLSNDETDARRTLEALDRDQLTKLENAVAAVGRIAFEVRKALPKEAR